MSWINEPVWQFGVAALTLVLSVLAAGHALLHKRDTRGAVLWVGFIILTPLIGAVIYFMLGVNRIKRQAMLLRARQAPFHPGTTVFPFPAATLRNFLPAEAPHLVALGDMMNKVLLGPLLPGNRVSLLVNGDEAYPAMIEAIQSARHSVALSTYIFDNDAAGKAFATALGDAAKRGVLVRVLVDATGARYSWPSILGVLRREGVEHARFLPALRLGHIFSINLRNHRKLLVVDGTLGFTGGMNIRAGHWLSQKPSHPVRDIQFRVTGPVVSHLQEAFAADWVFTTQETLRGDSWFPPLAPQGPVLARGIPDGPDEDFENLRWAILGALTVARHSARIMTPYFLPDSAIISALNLATMRGVEVDIVLPEKNNLPVVQWASIAHWWQVLEHGCKLWLTPPPFDHSKAFVVDDCWSLVGSTNWDPRSLRLNFEFNLECYDLELARALNALMADRIKTARQVTFEEVTRRNLALRLRDGIARLLTPFL